MRPNAVPTRCRVAVLCAHKRSLRPVRLGSGGTTDIWACLRSHGTLHHRQNCGYMRRHGVAAGPCLRGVLLRVVLGTLVSPLWRWGGTIGSGVAWAVFVVWVGVSALRLWAEWQGSEASTTDGWSPTHRTRPAVASSAFVALRQLHALRRRRARQRGGPASASPGAATRPGGSPSPSPRDILARPTRPLP